jgi:ABC-2 type transport system permease protein
MLSFPVEVCVGGVSRGAAVTNLGVEWLYALGLLGAAMLLWRRGVARFAAYGG